MTEVSLIIRTHSEEKWIGECLRAIDTQTLDDFEIVLIDNLSTDKTVEKVKNIYPDLIHVEIDDYLPGLALNKGIRAYPPASTLSVYPPTVSRSTMSG